MKLRKRISKQDYSIALTNPLWKGKRFRILERDGYKCTKCGSKEELHVHHLKYEGTYPWQTRDSYLTTLCKKCHKNAHRIIDKSKNIKIMQKIEVNQYRIYEGENIVKVKTLLSGNKNITDLIGEDEEQLELVAKALSYLRDVAKNLLNVQKSGTLKIGSYSSGELTTEIQMSIDFKSTPMTPTKKDKMMKEAGYIPKEKANTTY